MTITLNPTEPGEYNAQIYLFDKPILVAPLRATCSEKNAACLKSKMPVKPSDLKNAQTNSGSPLGLQYDPLKLTAKLTAPNGAQVKGELNAQWQLSFQPSSPGIYHAQFYSNGAPVLRQPYPVHVQSGAPRKQSINFGQAVQVGAGGLNVNLEKLSDEHGIPLLVDSTDLSVVMTHDSGAKERAVATIQPNGTIQVFFNPQRVGNYTSQVSVNGHAILDPPLSFHCTEPCLVTKDGTRATATPQQQPTRAQLPTDQQSAPLPKTNTPNASLSNNQTMLLNELLQKARDCAAASEHHDLHAKRYDLVTLQKKVTSSILALAPLYKTDWPQLLGFEFNRRFQFFESISEALIEFWSELKPNFGLFLDQKVQTNVVDCFVTITNDLIETVNLMKEVVTASPLGLTQLQHRYNGLQRSSQSNNSALVACLKQYIPRATTSSPILGITLGGSPATISNAIATWYNQDKGSLSTLEHDLGQRLSPNLSDSISLFTNMVKELLQEARDDEPDFGVLVRRMLHILMFVRAYSLPRLQDQALNTMILSLNELSSSFVLLSAAKLKYAHNDAANVVANMLPILKDIAAILKEAH